MSKQFSKSKNIEQINTRIIRIVSQPIFKQRAGTSAQNENWLKESKITKKKNVISQMKSML